MVPRFSARAARSLNTPRHPLVVESGVQQRVCSPGHRRPGRGDTFGGELFAGFALHQRPQAVGVGEVGFHRCEIGVGGIRNRRGGHRFVPPGARFGEAHRAAGRRVRCDRQQCRFDLSLLASPGPVPPTGRGK